MKISDVFSVDNILCGAQKAKDFIIDCGREAHYNMKNEQYSNGYQNGKEEGINYTAMALLYADVKDDVAIRELMHVWKIDEESAISLVVGAKTVCIIEIVKKHLRLKGWSEHSIERFMKYEKAEITICRNVDLWEYRDSPEKLMKLLEDRVKKDRS